MQKDQRPGTESIRNSQILAPQDVFEDYLTVVKEEFSKRLKLAFLGSAGSKSGSSDVTPAEMARRLRTTGSTVKLYLDGERLPTAEMFLRIHNATGVNIHWLLTGQGPSHMVDVRQSTDLFTTETELMIRDLARDHGITYEEAIRRFTIAGLEFMRTLTEK